MRDTKLQITEQTKKDFKACHKTKLLINTKWLGDHEHEINTFKCFLFNEIFSIKVHIRNLN